MVVFHWYRTQIPVKRRVDPAHPPPGQRYFSLEFGSADLTALLIGGVLAVIAWVMEEGRKLQEEQDLTI